MAAEASSTPFQREECVTQCGSIQIENVENPKEESYSDVNLPSNFGSSCGMGPLYKLDRGIYIELLRSFPGLPESLSVDGYAAIDDELDYPRQRSRASKLSCEVREDLRTRLKAWWMCR